MDNHYVVLVGDCYIMSQLKKTIEQPGLKYSDDLEPDRQ